MRWDGTKGARMTVSMATTVEFQRLHSHSSLCEWLSGSTNYTGDIVRVPPGVMQHGGPAGTQG